jgi:recombination protein RecT
MADTGNNLATVERMDAPVPIAMQLKQKESQFAAALPAHIPVERFMRVVQTAIQSNPELALVERRSLWNSAMKAASDGLLPDGREGAFVIFNAKEKDAGGREHWIKKAQWMPMIAGIRKKVRNSGEIATWDAHVVHEKDAFEYELGDQPYIKHKPAMVADPGPVVAAYSVATLKSGEKSREVMTRAELEKVHAASKSAGRGPWVDWFDEMARKTVAKRHAKVLPMSTDLDDLMRRDDDLYDLGGAREEARAANQGRPQNLAGKLQALAGGPPADDWRGGQVETPEEPQDAPERPEDAPATVEAPETPAAPTEAPEGAERPAGESGEVPAVIEGSAVPPELAQAAYAAADKGRRALDRWRNTISVENADIVRHFADELNRRAHEADARGRR